MEEITAVKFNEKNNQWTYNLNGTGVLLTNGSQFQKVLGLKRPHLGRDNEKFLLIGSGNYLTDNKPEILQVVLNIISTENNGPKYVLDSVELENLFQEFTD